MISQLQIDEISKRIINAAEDLVSFCHSLPEDIFFKSPESKWSPARQVKHLITATNTARLAFILPKFIVRVVGGKPNRASRTYDELVAKYKLKLEQGGRASGRYIPKPVSASYGKEKLLVNFTKSMHRFSAALQKNWKEPQPDNYIIPHPLLGKITLRELCYFTIYHTYHHRHNISKMVSS